MERRLSLYDGSAVFPIARVTEFCGEMQGKFKVGLARLSRRLKAIPWDAWARERNIGMNCEAKLVPRLIS